MRSAAGHLGLHQTGTSLTTGRALTDHSGNSGGASGQNSEALIINQPLMSDGKQNCAIRKYEK